MRELIILILLVACTCPHIRADDDKIKLQHVEFQRKTLQRSWHYASLLIHEGSDEVKLEHARSMTCAAFHYWLMRKSNLIEKMGVYEIQIKNTFKNGDLSKDLLEDPLGRLSIGKRPTYSLPGFDIGDADYVDMVKDFKAFVLSN